MDKLILTLLCLIQSSGMFTMEHILLWVDNKQKAELQTMA